MTVVGYRHFIGETWLKYWLLILIKYIIKLIEAICKTNQILDYYLFSMMKYQ